MEGLDVLVSMLAGVVGVPLANAIKNQFGLEGKPAVWMTFGVAIVLAVVALFLSGQMSFIDFTPERAVSMLGVVFSTATLIYKLIVK